MTDGDVVLSSTAGVTQPDWKQAGGSLKSIRKGYDEKLTASKKWRKDAGFEDTWKLMVDLYSGKHFSGMDLSQGDKIMINVAFSTKNVISPSVSINRPKVAVHGRRPEHEVPATLAEQAVNYWWHKYRFQPEIRRAVDDFIISGHGWAKVGYRYVEAQRPASFEERQAQFDQLSAEASAKAAADPNGVGALPSDEELAAQLTDTVPEVIEDRPFVERVSPQDIFIDPEATSVEDLKWIAQRIVMPLADVKQNQGFDVAARNKVQADSSLNPRWRDKKDGRAAEMSDGVARATVWEFYDLRAKTISVFAEAGEGFLVKPTALPYRYGNPFVFLANYNVPDRFYPIGDLEMLEPIQRELNETRSQMMNHRKRYNRKYIANRTYLDEAAMQALESDEDNAIVFIDNETPLGEVVQPLPITSTPPEFYNYSQIIESDMDLVSAVSEYQRGSIGETRRTATEAAMIQDSVNARSADKLAAIEIWLGEIAERVVMLAQQFLTGEQTIRVLGPLQGQEWISFTREDMDGEFDFEVEAGSTQPRSDTMRRQTALQLAQVLSPYVNMTVNPQELVRYVLEDGFGIKDPSRFLLNPMAMGVDPQTGMPMDPNAVLQQQGMQPQGVMPPSNALPQSGPNMDPGLQTTQQQMGRVSVNLPNSGAQ